LVHTVIARITRTLLVLQLIAAAGIGWLASRYLRVAPAALAMVAGFACVLLLRLLITANNFFLAWRFASDTPEEYRLTLRQACALFSGEFRATMTASSWTMPFHAFTKRIASQPTGLPVLLIHGYGCNSGYWHSMSKALQRERISHYAVSLEPVMCGIDEYVPLVQAVVERLCSETGQHQILIVAHSMGGLAARAYLRKCGSHRIAKVITLGTPHHGTGLAQFGLGMNTMQMRWTAGEQEGLASPWLRALAADEDTTVYQLFVSIFSHHDNIVSPQTSSYLAGAKNIALFGIGHVALASNRFVQTLVIDEILAASRSDTKAKLVRSQS
jgi:triacylglycerol lipase